jgi:hypothetical protein
MNGHNFLPVKSCLSSGGFQNKTALDFNTCPGMLAGDFTGAFATVLLQSVD